MKKCMSLLTFIILSLFAVNIFAGEYVYEFNNHPGEESVEYTNGKKLWGDDNSPFLKATALIHDADNTVGITLERIDGQFFEEGTVFLQNDSWDSNADYFQDKDSVNAVVRKSLDSLDSLDSMNAEWSGNSDTATMNMYGRYIWNGKGMAWVGPITIKRTKKAPSSKLRVYIKPVEAIEAGAMWRPKGSIKWYESGQLTDDPVYEGTMTVEFKQLTQFGYEEMQQETVMLKEGVTEIAVIYQSAGKGCFQGFTKPENIGSFKIWLTDYGDWSASYFSGTVICDLDPGQLDVEFNSAIGWETPAEVTAIIDQNKTKSLTGLYCLATPDPPSNVRASDGMNTESITIKWDPNPCPLEYIIYRGTQNSPTNTSDVKILNANSEVTGYSYVDTSAKAGKKYYYWVSAHTIDGDSPISAYDTGYLQLPAPSNIKGSKTFKDFIKVTYDSVEGASGYEVWRSSIPNPAYSEFIKKVSDLFFDDEFPIYEKAYYYWLRAVNDLTTSEFSPLYGVGKRVMPAVEFISASDRTYINEVQIRYKKLGNEEYHGIVYDYCTNDCPGEIDSSRKRTVREDQELDGILIDKGAIAEKPYYYKIIAYNNYNKDTPTVSRPDKGVAQMEPVKNLMATQGAYLCKVTLTWDPVKYATKYMIWRNTTDDKLSAVKKGETQNNFYHDTDADRSYFYWVEATNEHTTSATSSWSPTYEIGFPAVCEYDTSVPEITFNKDGGTGSFTVLPNFSESATCSWKISTTADWMTNIVPKSGTGEQTITFEVAASNVPRSGSIEISGDDTTACNNDVSSVNVNHLVLFELNLDGTGEIGVNGSKTELPYNASFDPNEEVTLQSFCKEGFVFDTWTGDYTGTDETTTIIMNSDKTITANCIETVDLCVNIKGKGSVAVSNGTTVASDSCFTMPKGLEISLQANPESDDISFTWSGDLQGSEKTDWLTMDSDKEVTANFTSPGWSFNITSSRGDSSPTVLLGIRSEALTLVSPPLPPSYDTSILLNRFYESDWKTSLYVDIKKEVDDPSHHYYWGISVNPAGNSGPLEATTLLTWDADFIDPENFLRCELLEGYTTNGNVVITDMKAVSEMEVSGNRQDQYFTVHCYVPPEHPVIKCSKDNSDDASRVYFDTGATASNQPAPPLPPEYDFDCALISMSETVGPVWDDRLLVDIREEGQDFYTWVLAVNPKGNTGSPVADGSVVLKWDLSAFNEGDIGYWKLFEGIQGHIGDYKLKIGDMKSTREMTVTGNADYQYFSIVWHRDWSLHLNSGWNLVSLNVTPEDSTLLSMIPDAIVAYEFKDGGYHLVSSLKPSIGYWVKVPAEKTYFIKGVPLKNFSKSLISGWNLVGSVIGLAAPTTIPDNCIQAIFSYQNGGYQIADIFSEGNGYWVKTSDVCELFVESQ